MTFAEKTNKVNDLIKIMAELREALNNEDYKIIKCAEALLSNENLPYDIDSLRSTRQEYRNRINEIEEEIAVLENITVFTEPEIELDRQFEMGSLFS